MNLNTFDILNCEAKGWFRSMIGHTAVIYRNIDGLWVYESTQRDGANGVTLTPYDEWLAGYPGKVWVRKCNFNRDIIMFDRCDEHALAHTYEYLGTPYPNLKTGKGLWKLINAAIDWFTPTKLSNKDTDDTMFCTQLVAHLYRYCGLAEDRLNYYNPAEFEPDDMRDGGGFDSLFRDGVILDAEVQVK